MIQLTYEHLKGLVEAFKDTHSMHPLNDTWTIHEESRLYKDQVIINKHQREILVGNLPYCIFSTWGVNEDTVGICTDYAYRVVKNSIDLQVGFINSRINYKYQLI